VRADLDVVAGMVAPGSRVLDLGCGDGSLLAELIEHQGCRGQGVEVAPEAIHACVARGIAVVQADIDQGLPEFEDASFDVVVLSQTLQATHRPALVLREMTRVGRLGIVSFPNFAHWRPRIQLLARGRMPVTPTLPYRWYETPNIHLCTLRDFEELAHAEGLAVMERRLLDPAGGTAPAWTARRPNLLAAGAAYLLRAAVG
jgi:methionine biosynthesis protein MetW